MIAFRDFLPPTQVERSAWKGDSFAAAPLSQIIPTINAWIASEGIDVVNIETVVLPSLFSPQEDGTTDDSHLRAYNVTDWHQVVRVWYRAP